jgi:S-adenosylmethionine synthetase
MFSALPDSTTTQFVSTKPGDGEHQKPHPMRNIVVEELKRIPLEKQRIEIVERKGRGHPDYICDSIMDQISINLSQEYLKRFGAIMHHNIDKAYLVAGEVERKLGGGRVVTPMKLIFGDRATYYVGKERVPVEEIAINTAKHWFKESLRFVDPEVHVNYQIEIKPGSTELTDIFARSHNGILPANDTSAAVGYAPFSRTENMVLKMEQFLNSPAFKHEHPESGEDIKVMAFRKDDDINLTIAMAMVDRFIENEAAYNRKKQEILDHANEFAGEQDGFSKTSLAINTLDDPTRGMGGMYLTVTGTSAEDADGGQVGRGNRVNGIHPLHRPASSEAAAGKNPVSHIGKIYNLLANRIADKIHKQVPDVAEVYIWLVSSIGKPIDQPAIAAAQMVLNSTYTVEELRPQVSEIIDRELSQIASFCQEIAEGKHRVC